MSEIVIAIDGYSSCGKSTLAVALAKELGYIYMDSGAMYRAVTLFFLQQNIDYENEDVTAYLPLIHIDFKMDEELQTFQTILNGTVVNDQIRSQIVSNEVSEVSTIKEVRSFLVEQQREIGKNRGIVMDGRDIGTVVFPNAELKFFLTADLDIRARRRYMELQARNVEITLEDVIHNLEHRDYIDTHRKESPLHKANDAIVIDNSILSIEEQFSIALRLATTAVAKTNQLLAE